MDSWLSAMSRLFPIWSPWLLSNLFCCLWKHGSFPSMNSFSPRNQLWLVLFNINLPHFFKERYQSIAAHPCLWKAPPLLLTDHSLNQKGRRKQLGFTFLFFFFQSTQMSTSSRMFGTAELVMEQTKSAWSKIAGGPLLKWREERKPQASLKCEWVQRPQSHVYLHRRHAEPTKENRNMNSTRTLLHLSCEPGAALDAWAVFCYDQQSSFPIAL